MGFEQKAEQEAIEALRIEPYNAKAFKLLGRIYNERGDYDDAFENLRKAKLIDPHDMKVRYQMAVALYYLGEAKKAKEQCQIVLDQNPENNKGLLLLSLIYANERKYNKMTVILQKVRQYDSQEVKGLLKIGNLLMDQKAFHQAKDVLAMALEIDPENEEVKGRINLLP